MICGIDPGLYGAIAFIYDDGHVYIEDMPRTGKEIAAVPLANMFREFPPDHVYLEHVNSFGMGRQSAFNFGQTVGMIRATLSTLDFPYTQVTPAKWKQYFRLGRDKDASRMAAMRLYPSHADKFKRVKDDGRAEALLIARYGKETGTL